MGFPLTSRSMTLDDLELVGYKVKFYRNFSWFRDFGKQQWL